jgi:O-antigen/teichoic acid export membrane protein
LWATAEGVFTLVVTLIATIAAAAIMGTREFGLGALASLIGTIAEVIVAIPFSEGLIARRRLSSTVISTANVSMISLGVGTFLLLCASGPFFAYWLQEPILVQLIPVQGLCCILLALRGVPEVLLARGLAFKTLSVRQIVAKAVSALVIMVLALSGAGSWALVLGNVAFALTATVIVLKVAPRLSRSRVSVARAKQLFSFGIYPLIEALLWTITQRTYIFILGFTHGVGVLGQVSLAFRINEAMGNVLASVSTRMAYPLLATLSTDHKQLNNAFLSGTHLMFVFTAPCFLGAALISTDFITVLLGRDWLATGAVLSATSLFSLFAFARILVPSLLKSLNQPQSLLWIQLIGLVYIIAGTLFAVEAGFEAQLFVWGSAGIVYFLVSLSVVSSVARIAIVEQLLPLRRALYSLLGLSLTVVILNHLLGEVEIHVRLMISVALGAAVYIGSSVLLEAKLVKHTLSSKFAPRSRRQEGVS